MSWPFAVVPMRALKLKLRLRLRKNQSIQFKTNRKHKRNKTKQIMKWHEIVDRFKFFCLD